MFLDLWQRKPMERIDWGNRSYKDGLSIINGMIEKLGIDDYSLDYGGKVRGNSSEIRIYFKNGYRLYVKCTHNQFMKLVDILEEIMEE